MDNNTHGWINRLTLTGIATLISIPALVSAFWLDIRSILGSSSAQHEVEISLQNSSPIGINWKYEFFRSHYTVLNYSKHAIYIARINAELGEIFSLTDNDGIQIDWRTSIPYLDKKATDLPSLPISDLHLSPAIKIDPGEKIQIEIINRADLIDQTMSVIDLIKADNSIEKTDELSGLGAFAPESFADFGNIIPHDKNSARERIYIEETDAFFKFVATNTLKDLDIESPVFGVYGFDGSDSCTRHPGPLVLIHGCTKLDIVLLSGDLYSSNSFSIGRQIIVSEERLP